MRCQRFENPGGFGRNDSRLRVLIPSFTPVAARRRPAPTDGVPPVGRRPGPSLRRTPPSRGGGASPASSPRISSPPPSTQKPSSPFGGRGLDLRVRKAPTAIFPILAPWSPSPGATAGRRASSASVSGRPLVCCQSLSVHSLTLEMNVLRHVF